jgi:hypothetical protein
VARFPHSLALEDSYARLKLMLGRFRGPLLTVRFVTALSLRHRFLSRSDNCLQVKAPPGAAQIRVLGT